MSDHKKIKKKWIIALTLISFVFLSGVLFSRNFNNSFDDSHNSIDNFNNVLSSPSDTNLNRNVSGFGDKQKVRVYLENQSSSEDNSGGKFNIPAPSDNRYLDYGDFLFEFDTNYTTNHTIEDDPAPNDDFNITIRSNRSLGLEFDIRGKATTFHGFYAWIGIHNNTATTMTSFNISLYNASEYIEDRSGSELPDARDCYPLTYINSITINESLSEGYQYFDFPDTTLDTHNYFIVLSVNNTYDAYSLITLRISEDDSENDHLLEIKENSNNWDEAYIYRDPTNYTQLDASLFKINVSRGYMPSDFKINNNKTLRIQNIPLNDTTKGASFIYSGVSQWGVGAWRAEFPNAIKDGDPDEFEVTLNWNKTGTGINDFKFNVSYSVLAYSEEESTARYFADFNGVIIWTLNYTLEDIYNWNFTEFWFLYPWYHDNDSLITSVNSTDILDQTFGETSLAENRSLDKLVVPYELSNFSVTYQLNLTSYNALDQIHSYINYNGNLLETSGFMRGDNMTISADISGPDMLAPSKGTANATLFDPNQSENATDTNSSGSLIFDDTLLKYDFNNKTLLEIDETIIEGTYYLGIVWENGSLIGIDNIPIYVNHYELSFGDVIEKEEENSFPLKEITRLGDTKYTLFGASINRTSKFPADFYSIRNENINQKFIYEISGNEIELELKEFLQNESILNPGEDITFKVSLKNNQKAIRVENTRVSIKLVSPINNDWIMNTNTSISKTLEGAGDPAGEDQKSFTITLQMPDIDEIAGNWPGYNSPIRLGGAKVIVSIYIEDEIIHTYKPLDYSLLVNETEDKFEGYILALPEPIEQSTAELQSIQIARDKCIYAPNSSNLLINIQDSNHVSSYQLLNNSYYLKTSSTFQSINSNPETPIQGKIFNLTSKLITEFGNVISGETVNCEYFNGTIWKEINDSPKITDSFGITNFQIDTSQMEIEDNHISLRLLWNGNENIINETHEFNISLFSYTNEISIDARIRNSPIYRNDDALLDLRLINTGDSNMNITNISLSFSDINPSYEIVQQESSALDTLELSESRALVYKINFGSIPTDTLMINISVMASNIDTQEQIISEKSISVSVIDYPLFQRFFDSFTVIMLMILGLIIAISLYYAYILKRRIETPVSKPEEKKRRKGAYKKVSELKEEKEEKEEKPSKKKRKTDLDSLLEEEGI